MSWFRGVIGEGMTCEVDRGRVGIVDFNPVRIISVLVGDDPIVAGHELSDPGGRGHEGGSLEED